MATIVVAGTAVFAGGGWLGFATTHSSPTYSHARTLALAAGIEVLGVTLPTTAGQWGIAAMTASVTGSNGPYTCSWTFGDGGTSTSCSPSHSWTSGGTFTVGLTVTNGASHASASMVVGANAAYVTGSGGGFAPSLWSFAFSFPCKGVAVGGFPGQPCGVPIELPPGNLGWGSHYLRLHHLRLGPRRRQWIPERSGRDPQLARGGAIHRGPDVHVRRLQLPARRVGGDALRSRIGTGWTARTRSGKRGGQPFPPTSGDGA